MPQQLAYGSFEVATMDDTVEHAVIEQELRGLKPFRQILPERLLDDARSTKTDNRAGLGENRVAEHRVAGADTAGCRVGQDRDVRNATLGEHGEDGGDFGHLHEREHAFLHTRTARRRNHDQWILSLERSLTEAGNLLADHRAHRSAHEGEIHDTNVDRQRVERTGARQEGVGLAGIGDSLLEALRIVGKAERVSGPEVDLDLLHRAFVEHDVAIVAGANATVIVAVGANVHIPLDLLADIRIPAALALPPDVRGDLEPLAAGLPRLFLPLIPPGHWQNLGTGGA